MILNFQLFIFFYSVYVSKDGTRNQECTQSNPCESISDVLFNRKDKITVFLDPGDPNTTNLNDGSSGEEKRRNIRSANNNETDFEDLPHEYELLLPLNLKADVTLKSYYPELSDFRPIITTKQKRLFIMQNHQGFRVENVNFHLPDGGILLEIDSRDHLLDQVTLKNSDILIGEDLPTPSLTGVYMKNYQTVNHIYAENVTIGKGSLIKIKGDPFIDTAGKMDHNIGELEVHFTHAGKILSFETIGASSCNVSHVIVTNCTIDYGLHVVDSICQIRSFQIQNTTVKHTGIHVKEEKRKSSEVLWTKANAYERYTEINRYLSNLPFSYWGPKKKAAFKISTINMDICEMTTAIELSNIGAPFIVNSLEITNSRMENSIEITETSFDAKRIVIKDNKIARNIYLQKRGDLSLENVEIRSNKREEISKAFVYQAGTDTKFHMDNVVVEWENISEAHPPLMDIYLGDGNFNINNVFITSYSIYMVTLAAIEIGNDGDKHSSMKNLRMNCTDNSNATHTIEGSIRGKIMHARCNPCEINKYTRQKSFMQLGFKVDNGTQNATDSVQNLSDSVDKTVESLFDSVEVFDRSYEFKCYNCPIGGSCKNGIKSSGNFYGYSIQDGTVIFTACPKNYCCSKKECIEIDSCRFNRTGVLCGSCKEGYQEDLFSENCMRVEECKNKSSFWVVFLIVTLLLCVLFLYLKDLKPLFKGLGIWIWTNIKKCGINCKKCCQSNDIDEEKNESEMKKLNSEGEEEYDEDNPNAISSNGSANKDYEEEHDKPEEEPKYTMSGCINIIVGFYQMRSLLTVDVGTKYRKSSTYQETVTEIMNLDFVRFISSLCPWEKLTPVGEGFIVNQLVIALTLGWAILILLFYFVIGKRIKVMYYRKKKKNNNELSSDSTPFLRFSQRIGIGIIRIILFGYKNVATFAIVMVHCVPLNGRQVMFIAGQKECYSGLQYVSAVLIAVWVIPFPFALWRSYRMYMSNRVITMREFVISLIFPFAVFYFMWKTTRITETLESSDKEECVRILLDESFQEAYRDRKGKDYKVFWETWRLYQRLILAFVTTFAINPVERICFSAPIILFFIFVYWYVKPYKKHFVVLHWMEVASLLGITFTLVNNMFRSFLYVFEIPDEKPVPQSLSVLWALDTIASPVFVFIIMKLWPSIKKLWEKVRECFQGVKDRI